MCSWILIISHAYSDVIMSAIASQITGVSIVCSTICSIVDERTHRSSASLAFVTGGFPSERPSNTENVSMTSSWYIYFIIQTKGQRITCIVCIWNKRQKNASYLESISVNSDIKYLVRMYLVNCFYRVKGSFDVSIRYEWNYQRTKLWK